MDLKEQILVALGLNKDEEVKLGWQAKSEDGTIFVSSFRVEEEGIVGEVIESETEEEDTEEEVDAGYDDKEEMTEEVSLAFPETDAEKADWAKSYEEMKDKVDNLMDAVADLKARIGEGDSEAEEMSEETSEEVVEEATPKSIKKTEVVEFTSEEVEAIKAENEKLKTELAETPAESPINTNKFSVERKPLSTREYKKLTRQERFLYNLNK